MGKSIHLRSEVASEIKKCTGIDCDNSDNANMAISALINKANQVQSENQSTPKKIKGKWKQYRTMSVEHKHEIDYSKLAAEVAKTQPNIINPTQAQQPQQSQEDKWFEHLKLTKQQPNYIGCKNCGKIPNPNKMKVTKACPNCEANTVHPDADICPYCGNTPEEWEDGIDIELED